MQLKIMNEQKQTLFPKAILSVNREEYYHEQNDPNPESHQLPLELTIKKQLTEEKTILPTDLQGSVFIMAPVGSIDSLPVNPEVEENRKIVLPAEDGWTSLLNGDGMMFRLDFNEGQANLSSRFVNSLSHYADKIAHQKYPKLKFINLELARLSLAIGQSNQVNTAFLAMKFPEKKTERLLATWDAGRAYEIDPVSLKVIAPVGSLQDWSELVELPITFPFKQIMTSAHPSFDPYTGEMFTLNLVRSFSTLLWISRLFTYDAQKCIEHLPFFLRKCADKIVTQIAKILTIVVQAFTDLLARCKIGSEDELYLICWNGADALQKWKVVLPNGQGVVIRQTVHQMGITEDYIVVADTAFKIVLEDLIPAINPSVIKPKNKESLLGETEAEIDLEKKAEIKRRVELLRKYLSYPQFPNTYLYIIDRAQLKNLPSNSSITAKQVIIDREMAHFLVDYDNPDGKITLNAAHNTATDPAEFIHGDDISIYDEQSINKELQSLAGMLNDGLAINRPAFYVIDGATGTKEREEILDLSASMKNTWFLGLYAYRDYQPTQQFEDIYWLSFGAWTNTISQFFYEMYKDYQYRQEPLHRILDDSKNGVPVILSRMHIDRKATKGNVLSIADSYQFPLGYFASSPQFVPRPNTTGATDGYIVCTVIYSDNFLSYNGEGVNSSKGWSDNSEIWIFDAGKLHQGPEYRLSHPQLNFGFTLHTTWLEQVAPAPTREYDVKQDFDELVRECMRWHSPKVAQDIDKLFEEAYQAFNRNRKSV